jgi:hypothetical protein
MFETVKTADVAAAEVLMVYAGTPLQLDGHGAVAERSINSSGTLLYTDIIGAIGAQVSTGNQADNSITIAPTTGLASYKPLATGVGTVTDSPTKGLVNRTKRVGNSGASYPLSYRLVINARGIWLGVWEDATTAETSASFNWFLIQRPVDRTTGAVVTTGKAPVFCVNACGGEYWQFVVRESDILRPGVRRPADVHTVDSEAILNPEEQVSLSEDGKYIVTFPSRLNTSRYRYSYELDIIGTTSADVVSQYSDVPLRVYGEGSDRSYKALHATKTGNTGMRLLVLNSGGGIS